MVESEHTPLNSENAQTERAAKKLEIAQRQREVANMVLARMPQREIARLMNVSPATVNSDVARVRKSWNLDAQQRLEDFIGQELASLNADEAMWRGRMVQAADNVDLRLRIYDRIIKIGESRRKLLGLDAPIRLDLARAEARKLAEEYDLDVNELLAMADDIVMGRDR